MLAITSSLPPQRAHCSISIPNTRLGRRAQFSVTCFGVSRSGSRLGAFDPCPAGVIAARSAAAHITRKPLELIALLGCSVLWSHQ
jgi:hypothetical protein